MVPTAENDAPLRRVIEAVLGSHYPAPIWCKCGWRAPLQLNDTYADKRQTMGHVAEEIARVIPPGEGH